MSKILSAVALVAVTAAALAQPSQPPEIAVGGLSRCENLLGDEREKCQQDERAIRGGSTGPHSPFSTADPPERRIRATPSSPVAPTPSDQTKAVERDLQRCEALDGKEKDRCLRALHQAVRQDQRAPHEGPSPESTGAGAGAGSGAISAPR
jgi:hypothetical protein